MNNEQLIMWLAETILGGRPACAASVTIGDNGRHRSFENYRLVISYEDENGESGKIEVTPETWMNALKTSMGV